MERAAEKCESKAAEEVKRETKAADKAETNSFRNFKKGGICIKDNGSVFALPFFCFIGKYVL